MSVFVKATPAPIPKTSRVNTIALLYAILLVILAVAQLYSFDEFIELFPTYGVFISETLTYLLAPLLIVLEVFALPFLLRMRLSPAFRFVSMVSGWLVALLWLLVSVWILFAVPQAVTAGFLGTVVELVPGWWTALFSISLGILAAWASWGMWPVKRRKR